VNWKLLAVTSVLEVFSLIAMCHLWRKTDKWWPVKIWWTVVLLIPLLGLLFYVFIWLNPSPHGDNPPQDISGASVQ
jgi:hypothetical protein